MASYRGVDQKHISYSAQMAVKYVRRFNLGPATEAMLDAWEKAEVPLLILAAENDAELLNVLKTTNTTTMFKLLEPSIAYNTLCDTFERQTEYGLDTYQLLQGWNAFTQNNSLHNPEVRAEQTGYLLQQYIPRWRREDADNSERAAAMFNGTLQAMIENRVMDFAERAPGNPDGGPPDGLEEYIHKEEAAINEIGDLLGVFKDLHKIGAPEEIPVIAAVHPTASEYMTQGMAAAVNLGQHRQILEQTIMPLQTFGVVVGQIPDKPEELLRVNTEMRAKVLKSVEAFVEADEVIKNSFRPYKPRLSDQAAVLFRATRAAAEQFARNEPDLKVVDYTGRRLGPEGAGKPPNPFGPQPG